MKLLVIGLGKVGLPMAVYLQSLRHEVAGYDADADLMHSLRNGDSRTPWDVPRVPAALKFPPNLRRAVMGRDAVFICVPTPVVRMRAGAALSSHIVEEALTELAGCWSGLVVVASTLDPRSVPQVCSSRDVVYNPPLIRLGHVVEDLAAAPIRLIGGTDQDTMDEVAAIWQQDGAKVLFGDPVTIAAAKLAINASLSARVAWANDLAAACKRVDADPQAVAAIVGADPRIGSAYMTPGPPPAGPCLPRDMDVWSSIAGMGTLAHRIGLQHRGDMQHALHEVETYIARHSRRNKPKVGIFGLAYTPGGLDATGSFGMGVYKLCQKRGWTPFVNDPANEYLWTQHKDIIFYGSQLVIDEADIIVVATDWPEYESLDFKDKPVLRVDWRNNMVMTPRPPAEEPTPEADAPDQVDTAEPEVPAEPEPEAAVVGPDLPAEPEPEPEPEAEATEQPEPESTEPSAGDAADEDATAVSSHPYSTSGASSGGAPAA